MKLINLTKTYSLPVKASVITLGNFDGVHRGHCALIREVVKRAKRAHASSVVITFEPHTRAVLSPGKQQPVLSTLEEKAILLTPYGVDFLACITFDKKFAALICGGVRRKCSETGVSCQTMGHGRRTHVRQKSRGKQEFFAQ